MEFPQDQRLPGLAELFDGAWVWRTYCREFGRQEPEPVGIRIRGVSHTEGREAVVTYEFEWDPDDYIPNETLTFHLERDRDLRVFRFPDDDRLPGLGQAVDPQSALRLVSKYVMALPPRRMRVEVIRYRPGRHAVLRHRMGRSRLYVRVIRPSSVEPILKAGELIGRSAFTVPRLAGIWRDGGVMWLSEIPGENLRKRIQGGGQPDPAPLLDGLESLWSVPLEGCDNPPFNLPGAYRMARQIFEHVLDGDEDATPEFALAVQSLDPFAESWQPTCVAHNDFYDDQMVVLPDGGVALVDFEGAGPGDPMLDVGNFLAHLRWTARFGRNGDARGQYHGIFRREALERFSWNEQDLNLREAVCLFRICTNTVRHPGTDWRGRLATGLSLVNETLG